MNGLTRCPTCGNVSIDEWHATGCAYFEMLRRRVVAHAAKYDISAPAARDLFAHLRLCTDDGTQAMDRAITLMDLGWRPVVGFTGSENTASVTSQKSRG